MNHRFVVMLVAAVSINSVQPMAALAQEQEQSLPATTGTGTGSAARPKVEQDGDFRVDGIGYTLPYYFQEGRSFKDLDAHVFYAHPFHLVVDENQSIRFDYDQESRTLTIFVRRPASSEAIENALRKELVTAARTQSVVIEPGTIPYRLSPLKPSSATFQLSKGLLDATTGQRTLVGSGNQVGIVGQEGAIAVHFHDVPRSGALKIVRDLQAGSNQVLFKYRFGGITTETCTAKSTERGVQDLDIFKKLSGSGGTGTVARHQVARIADQLVEEDVFTVDCADLVAGSQLLERLMNQLKVPAKSRRVAGWDEVEKLTAFDPDSFRADLTRVTKDIRNEVVRDQVEEAFNKATSESQSEQTEGGLEIGWKGFGGSIEGSFGEVSSESAAEARRAVSDALKKVGYTAEWSGNRFVPKSVDVHSVADMESSWGRSTKFQFQVDDVAVGEGALLLTETDRTAVMKGSVRSELEEDLREIRAAFQLLQAELVGLPEPIPVGGITMYVGREADLPESWVIAKGQRVTDRGSPLFGKTLPDLREQFVRGAPDDQAVGDAGGQDRKPRHSHNVDVEARIYRDSINGWWRRSLLCIDGNSDGDCDGSAGIDFSPWTDNAILVDQEYYALVIPKRDDSESHGHHVRITESSAGRDRSYRDSDYDRDNRPEFVALHFIVRIK